MEDVQSLINTLQEENRALIAERDRFKKLASLYQAEAFEEKLKSLTTKEGYDKEREEQRRRDREEWEKEKVKERGELEKAWAKEKRRLEQARVKEKDDAQKLVEELAKEIRTEEAQKLVKERERWEKERLVEKEEWEKKIQETKKECRKQYSDEVTRWKEHMAKQKQTLDRQREQERSDWTSRVDALEERVSELQAIQHRSASSNGRPDDAAHTSSLAPRQSESPPPFSPTLSSGVHPPVSTSRESRNVSPDITDLSTESDLTPERDDESFQVGAPEHSATSPSQDIDMQDEPTIASAPLSAHKPLKIEGITLSDSRRAQYLTRTTTHTITPGSLPVSVSYNVLYRLYGTGTTSLERTSVGPKGKEYRVMTPSYSKHPQMPRAPGEPGLVLVTHDSIVNQSPWTLFYKLDTGRNPPKWGYAGEYECKEVGRFMGQDFAALSDEVKKTWGWNVCKRMGIGPLLDLRARMTLRKLGKRKPTDWEIQNEATNIKGGKSSCDLTQQDVINFFVSGEEHIKVISVQCVGYIHSKAHELMAEQQKSGDATFPTIVQPTVSSGTFFAVGKRTWESFGGATTSTAEVGEGSIATSWKRRKVVGTAQAVTQPSTSGPIRATRVEPQVEVSREGTVGEGSGQDEDGPDEDEEGDDDDDEHDSDDDSDNGYVNENHLGDNDQRINDDDDDIYCDD